ncbi:hypothetical protein D3C85_966260 [compost metagenome]
MTTIKRNLHWTAVVGIFCSFWLLFWLFFFLATLYDLKQPDADSSIRNTLTLVSVLVLWAGYRASRRLALLRYGEFRQASIVKRTERSYDNDFGIAGKVTLVHCSFMLNNQSYSNFHLWTPFGLRKKGTVEIVYNTRKPSYFIMARRLRAYFDIPTNQWRSSMWHVIPRLTFMIIILAGIFALLFLNTIPWS